jgi:hypothetical protein
MKLRKTRKRRQRGGDALSDAAARITASASASSVQPQIIHCISQLKRFAPHIVNKKIPCFQFFYNLGRLQELLGETGSNAIFWKPLEALIRIGNYDGISDYIDRMQQAIGLPYDHATLIKNVTD